MMAVHKDDSGRRKVQVEVEVPGKPEEVWRAIATAAGISSWFVPTTTEYDAEGKPIRMTSDFGPGMESISKITEWNPPHSFSADSKDLGDDAPTVATQWVVESRGPTEPRCRSSQTPVRCSSTPTSHRRGNLFERCLDSRRGLASDPLC